MLVDEYRTKINPNKSIEQIIYDARPTQYGGIFSGMFTKKPIVSPQPNNPYDELNKYNCEMLDEIISNLKYDKSVYEERANNADYFLNPNTEKSQLVAGTKRRKSKRSNKKNKKNKKTKKHRR